MDSDKLLAERVSMQLGRGYWTVNNQHFFNKSDALRYASKVKNYDIKYSFLESAYRSLDWSREPSMSVEELYIERAKQLRDKYDYLILSFSGGADSTNILNTFVDNNIRLDEVVSLYPLGIIEKEMNRFSIHDKNPDNIMFEYIMACKPRLDLLRKTNPEIKITVIDYAQMSIEHIERGDLSLVMPAGIAAAPIHVGHHSVGMKMKNIAEKRTVCTIAGLDKPRILYNQATNKFGSYFHDFNTLFGSFSEEQLGGYRPSFEYFYYTPELPQLTQKQSFLIKNELMKLLFRRSPEFNKMIKKKNGNILVLDMHNEIIKSAIYPKVASMWQADKETRLFYQSQSIWFHDTKYTTDHNKSYYDGKVKELVDSIDPAFIEYKDNRVSNFKHYFTEPIWF